MPRKPPKPASPSPPSDRLDRAEPFVSFPHPTPEQCRSVRDALLSFHGFPSAFSSHRRLRLRLQNPDDGNEVGKEEDDHEEGSTVLDGLVSTLLSQNTTDSNSRRAFLSLKSAFPSWRDVMDADPRRVEDAIRCGGLAATKAARIRSILRELDERRGRLCLEYLRGMGVEEVKKELSGFKGIGPKTVACVLMFNLHKDDFPVDTHVLHIAKSIGWVPNKANSEKAYMHLNRRIPDELKFDLNCLIFTHGKVCHFCSRKGGNAQQKRDPNACCPLSQYSCDAEKRC